MYGCTASYSARRRLMMAATCNAVVWRTRATVANCLMTEHPAASDWAAARAEKWRANLIGMEATLAPVDAPLIHALQLDRPCRIADVGCGGGGTTLEILRRAPAGSIVRGFDISPALVESARNRMTSADRDITFEVANVATAMQGPYDRLVSRFGIMFFDDPPAAFSNLFRWLAPGGRFAFATWGRLADNPWLVTVRDAVADVIEIPSPDPEAPGPMRYGESDKLLALLNRAGFAEIDVRDWRGTLAIGGGVSANDAASFALASFSSFAELLAEADDSALNEARHNLTTRFSRHQLDGAVRMDACVHIFTGARQ